MERLYTSNEYKENNPTWDVEHSSWKAAQITKIIERNNLHPKSICEVGCGAGEILNQLQMQMNDEVSFVGFEISPEAYRLCETRKSDRLTFKLENFIENASDGYDIVMAIDVIEHVEDLYGFLKALKSKGNFKIFHIPLDISVQTVARMSPLIIKRKIVGHIHYFSQETAIETLKDSGYEIIDYFFTDTALAFPYRSFKSRLLRFPRKIGYKISPNLTVRMLGGYSLMVLAK